MQQTGVYGGTPKVVDGVTMSKGVLCDPFKCLCKGQRLGISKADTLVEGLT